MNVSPEVLLAEIELTTTILEKWKNKIQEGIPGVTYPGTEEALEEFVRTFCGELMILSGKCETLAVVLSEGGR